MASTNVPTSLALPGSVSMTSAEHARIGDDLATLLRICTKRIRKADTSAAGVVANISDGYRNASRTAKRLMDQIRFVANPAGSDTAASGDPCGLEFDRVRDVPQPAEPSHEHLGSPTHLAPVSISKTVF
jgi:hypothetical protein